MASYAQALTAAGCEVVVADLSVPLPHGDVVVALAVHETEPVADVGHIFIGDEVAAADVNLPADVSPRELVTVCKLLAEVVQLRRQLHNASDERDDWADQARHDSLTGLLNRRGWDEMIEQFVNQPGGIDRPLAVAIADVDDLKQLNTVQGLVAGDAALKAIADALRAGVRQIDRIARIGGDEFGIVFRGLDPRQLPFVLDRVRQQVAGRTRVSIGGASSTADDSTSLETLIAQADDALRQAKREGRNRVCIHGAA